MIEYVYRVPDEELPAPLPTLAEIAAAPIITASLLMGPKTRNMRPHFIVKAGHNVTLREAENMLFVTKHSSLIVPKLYAAYTDTETGKKYIVMEWIPGKNLGKAWGSLDEAARESMISHLKKGFDQLRSVPSPGYFGCLDGKTWVNTMLPATPTASSICSSTSPPRSAYEWVEVLITQAQTQTPAKQREHHYAALRTLYHEALDHLSDPSQAVFTHGDLHDRNVYIREGDNMPVVLDWETGAWCPPYHDNLQFQYSEALYNVDPGTYASRILGPCSPLFFLYIHYEQWQNGY